MRPMRCASVFSDEPDAGGLEIARDLGVPARALRAARRRDRAAYDRALAAAIDAYSPVADRAGRIHAHPVARNSSRALPDRILNIHPSLLPKYPGLHTHRRVLEAHEPSMARRCIS